MTETVDPLANIFNERAPKDINDFRNILEEAIESSGANKNLPEIGNFLTEVEISKKEDHSLTTDIHIPKGEGPFPILVYFHGGGWISGSPQTHRKICHRFAEAGFLVFNVDYALAPENPFPQGFDECCESLRWAVDNAAKYNGDSNRLSVGGDSAGGNLTAACAAALADDSKVKIKKILLIYGVFDFLSMRETSDVLVDTDTDLMMEMMVGSYLGPERDEAVLSDPRVSPIHVSDKLPPAHILCGTLDGLMAGSKILAEKLNSQGIENEEFYYENMPHGFLHFEDFFPESRQAIDRMVAFLNG
jgi:acetyl esterase